jgi:uncharacterized protein (DUF58 family)
VRRWSQKAILWAGLGVLVLAFGLWRWDVASTAVGVVLVLFLLAGYSRRTPVIELVRRPSHLRVLEGDRFEMGLQVGSRGAWADSVEIYDQLPGYMRLAEGSNHVVLPLYKGEVREASYALECPLRGAYRIGPLYVRATDALGLYDQELAVPDVHQLDVHPVWVELKQLELVSRALKYNMGPMTLNEPGRSTDFYSIRDYVKGDPYKKINWKATARLRKLMINEDEKETLSDCAVFVDSRAIAASGTALSNFHETAIRTTLGVARTLVANKNRVMVVTYNDAVNVVPPGLSRGHVGIVQAMLVETVARGALTFDWAVGFAGPFLKPRSDVVVLSPLVSDMSFYPTILALIRTGHRVVVVTAALEEYERLAMGGHPSPRALLLQLQRTTNVAELASAGIPVIQVAPDEPLLSIMVRLSVALGGERIDLGSLGPEGEGGEEGFGQGLAPSPAGPGPGGEEAPGTIDRLLTEAVGIDFGSRRLAAMQVGAIVALLLAYQLAFHLKADMWGDLGARADFRDYVNSGSYLLLALEAVLFAWLGNLVLGSAQMLKDRWRRPEMQGMVYLGLGLLGLWYLISVLIGTGTNPGDLRFLRFLVMLVPFFGTLAVLRRVAWPALLAAGMLMLELLGVPTPMSEVGMAVAMAVAVVVYAELAWAVGRFEGLVRALPRDAGARTRELLARTMDRYALVLGATALAAAVGAGVLLWLPGWYVDALGPGTSRPLEAGTVFAGVYWLAWLVALAVLGRWAGLYLAGTPRGRGLVERLRRRMVWPRARSGRGVATRPVGGPVPADDEVPEAAVEAVAAAP